MGAPPRFEADDIERIKLNVEGWSVSRWAEEFEVSYRTIQKIVLGLTYRGEGPPLGDAWPALLERQKPGPKVLAPAIRMERTPIPSNLRGNEAEIRKLYDAMIGRLAERFNAKPVEIMRVLALTGAGGNTLGRAAKFNAQEVAMIREQYRQNKTYAEIGRHWGVSRTTIARILGRGQYTEDSYTPRKDTSEVTDDEG